MKARKLATIVLFVILATANSGGYRYGIGDQAFYQPATVLRLHPELFPRDRALIESQARLTVVDEALAAAARVTRLDPPALFFLLYVVTLVATAVAAEQLATVLGLSPAATTVFLLLLTLRHRIAKTGANTLEGYMHPRQLAFALGLFAFTASMRRRWGWLAICWVLAAVIHPTTALWWAVAIGSGLVLTTAGRQRAVMALALVMLIAGRALAGWLGLPVMDADWLRVFAAKDYLFASGWPAYAWLINLAYLPLILLAARAKGDGRLVAPAVALFAVFIASYALTEAHVALAVQLQVSRVFWLMDLMLTLLVAWVFVDSGFAKRHRAMPLATLAVVMVLAVGRGVFTLYAAQPGRDFVHIDLPAGDWTDAMQFVRWQPADWLVLAHPDHAWLYGTSVRVGAAHDVVVESVKDSAISMYDRDVAMRTAERLTAVADIDALSSDDLLALGRRMGASVAVLAVRPALTLPVLYQNATFAVYDLR